MTKGTLRVVGHSFGSKSHGISHHQPSSHKTTWVTEHDLCKLHSRLQFTANGLGHSIQPELIFVVLFFFFFFFFFFKTVSSSFGHK